MRHKLKLILQFSTTTFLQVLDPRLGGGGEGVIRCLSYYSYELIVLKNIFCNGVQPRFLKFPTLMIFLLESYLKQNLTWYSKS